MKLYGYGGEGRSERTKYVHNAFKTLKDEKQIFYTI